MRNLKDISAFDIIGPVMIGPSSSHTAGAVFLGQIASAILGQKPTKAIINLHGSFAKTFKGHGTDKALIAGLLNLMASDERIKNSFVIAEKDGLEFEFNAIELEDAHPNTVQFYLWGKEKKAEVIGSSLGGGLIEINCVQGRNVSFNGDFATLLVFGKNQPGTIYDISGSFVENEINIAYLRVERLRRGDESVTVLETDDPIPTRGLIAIRDLSWVEWVCQIDKLKR